MTQTTASHANAKPSDAAGPFGTFTMPNTEIPAAFREAAEKSIAQAKDAFDQIKVMTESASSMAQETFESAREHGVALALKTLDASKANADASFDFFKGFFSAKTATDAIELQTAFAKKMFDTFSAQAKDFSDASQHAATEIGKPAKAAWNKATK